MIQTLQNKLDTLNYNLNNDIIAEQGLSFMLGQQELLMELLDSYYSHLQNCHDEYYDGNDYYGDESFAYDPVLDYYNDLKSEIEIMYEKHNHHTNGLGKSILHSDNHWFTSDEIEAFRVIWQRRISAM